MAKKSIIFLVLLSLYTAYFSQNKDNHQFENAETAAKKKADFKKEFNLLMKDFDSNAAQQDYIANADIDKQAFSLAQYLEGMKMVHFNKKKGLTTTLSMPLLSWKTAVAGVGDCPQNINFGFGDTLFPFKKWIVTGSVNSGDPACAGIYYCPSTPAVSYNPFTDCLNGGDISVNGPGTILPNNSTALAGFSNSVTLITKQANDGFLINNPNGLPSIPTPPGFKMVYPGFSDGVSVRIGNANSGFFQDRISYNYHVTPANTLVKFAYALVLDDQANHPCGEQPFFSFRILDSITNTQITSPCGKFNVSASFAAFDATFLSTPPNSGITTSCIRYKPWTEASLDLSAFVGQTLVFQLTSGDCTNGGHFGYAYVDFECGGISGSAGICPNGNYACLTSPAAGVAYQWYGPLPALTPVPNANGGNTKKICVNNVTLGDQFLVQVTNSFGCNIPVTVTIDKVDSLKLKISTKRFGCNDTLQGSAIATVNSSLGINGTQGPFVFNWANAIGDSLDAITSVGPTYNSTPPGYLFKQPSKGPFVLIARTLDSSCTVGPDTFSFDSVPNFFLSAAALTPTVCKNDIVPIKTSIINGPIGNTYSYAWSPITDLKYVDVANIISSVPASGTDPGLATPFYKPGAAGYIAKTIVVTDNNKCKRSRTINFTVSNEEVPAFNIPDSLELICNWPDNDSTSKNPVFSIKPLTPCSLAVGCPTPSLSTTFGNGISSNLATTNPTIVPGDSNKKYIRMQFILKSSELAAAGLTANSKLSSLFFNVINPYSDNIPLGGRVLQSVNIGMACLPVATTAFANATFLTTPLSQVVALDTFKINNAGWFEFPFRSKVTTGVYESRAFVWDGVSNVLVDFKMKKPNAYSNVNNAEIEYTTTTPATANSTLFYNGSVANPTASNDPSVNQKRPNVRFNYCTNNADTLNYNFIWTSNRNDWSYKKSVLPKGEFTFNGTGTYNLKLNIKTKSNLCSKSDSVKIFVRPKVVFEPTPGSVLDSVCSNDNSMNLLFQVKPKLNGAFSGPGISNSLLGVFSPNPTGSNGALLMPLDNNIKFKITDSVKYLVKGKLCVDSALYVIRDFPFQSAKILNKNLIDTVLCIYDKGETLILSPGGFINPSFLNNSLFEIKPLDFGPGKHKITYNTVGECADKDSMTIRVVKKPIIALAATNDNACVPTTVAYTANVDPTAGYYEWSSLDFDTVRKSGLDFLYTSGGNKNVYFKFVDKDNCTANANINVNLKPSPIAQFLLPNNNTTLLNPVLTLNNLTIGDIGNTYAWAINNAYFDNQYNSQYTFNTVGEYIITMKVTNFYNCSDSISKNFSVTQQPLFFVPNAFNPKSSITENRKLIAKSFAVNSDMFNLYIYDRWGKEVFKTSDLNFAWPGTDGLSGKLCEPGVYVWKANYVDVNNTTQSASGSVSIIR
jgi:hypothetical protein